MINPFRVFSLSEVGDSITVMPNMYGRLNELGLFTPKGVTTDKIAIEEKNGSLALLATNVRGAPGSVGLRNKRKVRTFSIPQIIQIEGIEPDEVNGLRG